MQAALPIHPQSPTNPVEHQEFVVPAGLLPGHVLEAGEELLVAAQMLLLAQEAAGGADQPADEPVAWGLHPVAVAVLGALGVDAQARIHPLCPVVDHHYVLPYCWNVALYDFSKANSRQEGHWNSRT